MLLSLSAISQDGLTTLSDTTKFPVQFVTEFGDTLTIVNSQQLKRINTVKTERDGYREVIDSLKSLVVVYEEKDVIIDSLELSLKDERYYSDTINEKAMEVVGCLEEQNKEIKRKLKWSKIGNVALGVVSVVGFIAGLMLGG